MKKKILIALIMLLLVAGGFLCFIKSSTEVIVEIEPGGTVAVESIAWGQVRSKTPVDTAGRLTVTVKEDVIPNNQTGQLNLETPPLHELIENQNVTIDWKENSNKKKAEQIK